jgi:hypothetical protein
MAFQSSGLHSINFSSSAYQHDSFPACQLFAMGYSFMAGTAVPRNQLNKFDELFSLKKFS